jgi:hypothetical protein
MGCSYEIRRRGVCSTDKVGANGDGITDNGVNSGDSYLCLRCHKSDLTSFPTGLADVDCSNRESRSQTEKIAIARHSSISCNDRFFTPMRKTRESCLVRLSLRVEIGRLPGVQINCVFITVQRETFRCAYYGSHVPDYRFEHQPDRISVQKTDFRWK